MSDKILDVSEKIIDSVDKDEKEDFQLESKELQGYILTLLPIENFQQYYKKNLSRFSSFSEKKFLSSCKIPPKYFLDQPEDTRQTLLNNHESIIEETKSLRGKYLVILEKDNLIINSCRLDYNEFQDVFERVQIEQYTNQTPVKNFIKEGYLNFFIPYKELKQGQYNIGVFVDFPIMCNKNPVVHKGFYYVPTNQENNYKPMYVSSQETDFNDYQTLELLIGDSLKELKDLEEEQVVEKLKDKMFLRELEDVLIKLFELKAIPKSYIKRVIRYTEKNKLILSNVFSLIDVLLAYDEETKTYKASLSLRTIKDNLEKILKGSSSA